MGTKNSIIDNLDNQEGCPESGRHEVRSREGVSQGTSTEHHSTLAGGWFGWTAWKEEVVERSKEGVEEFRLLPDIFQQFLVRVQSNSSTQEVLGCPDQPGKKSTRRKEDIRRNIIMI